MKLYIKTFGCQMNDRDSEALMGLFVDRGYKIVYDPDEADVILVNTCSVREHAENRALSFVGAFKKKSSKIIGVIGCMAKNRGEEIFKKMLYVDLIVGPANFDKIPQYIEKIRTEKTRIIDIVDREREESFYRSSYRINSSYAQVVISVGCSNFCSYCVVPYVRGPLRARKPKDILEEIKRNVDLGIDKITLLGQNVNDYLYKETSVSTSINFVDLLSMIEKIEGVRELDFITNHPKNTSSELFHLMAESKKIKKHLHLPFQSGSNRILKLMNRGYTKEDYLKLVEEYKNIVKGTLSTDIIVGFPTETEDDFLETKHVLEVGNFKYAYIFKYSPRPHTLASRWNDDVSSDQKQRRHRILLDIVKGKQENLCPK